MTILNNNIEIYPGRWNAQIKLHENNEIYYFNHFMEYWETRERKFYRWLNDTDKKHINEHKEFYYNSLSNCDFLKK